MPKNVTSDVKEVLGYEEEKEEEEEEERKTGEKRRDGKGMKKGMRREKEEKDI